MDKTTQYLAGSLLQHLIAIQLIDLKISNKIMEFIKGEYKDSQATLRPGAIIQWVKCTIVKYFTDVQLTSIVEHLNKKIDNSFPIETPVVKVNTNVTKVSDNQNEQISSSPINLTVTTQDDLLWIVTNCHKELYAQSDYYSDIADFNRQSAIDLIVKKLSKTKVVDLGQIKECLIICGAGVKCELMEQARELIEFEYIDMKLLSLKHLLLYFELFLSHKNKFTVVYYDIAVSNKKEWMRQLYNYMLVNSNISRTEEYPPFKVSDVKETVFLYILDQVRVYLPIDALSLDDLKY